MVMLSFAKSVAIKRELDTALRLRDEERTTSLIHAR